MLKMYPKKKPNEMIRHLFHGTKGTDPKLIYESKYGLDIRFARSGLYGEGIYFAEHSSYSHQYAH